MSFLDNLFTQQSSGGSGLPSSSESDISESRGFLATIASAITSSRMAVDLTAAVTGYLQTVAGAVASGNMKAILQAGTAVIGKLAANVGVNIGTVDVANALQLPPALGQRTKATSLSITVASDQNPVLVSDGGTPLMVIGNGGNPLPVTGLVAVSNTVPTILTTALPAGSAAIGKLAANPGVTIGSVDLNASPQLPGGRGAQLVADSMPVTLATNSPPLPVSDSTTAGKLDSIITGQAAPGALYGGRTTVATAGTRVVLGSSQVLTEGVELRGIDLNTGLVYPGNSAVTATTNGSRLSAKERCFIRCNNVNKVYIDAAVSGEGVTWIGW